MEVLRIMQQMQTSVHYITNDPEQVVKRFKNLSNRNYKEYKLYEPLAMSLSKFSNQSDNQFDYQDIIMIQRPQSVSMYAKTQSQGKKYWIGEKTNNYVGIRFIYLSDFSPYQRPESGNIIINWFIGNVLHFKADLRNSKNNFDINVISSFLNNSIATQQIQDAWDLGDPAQTTQALEDVFNIPLRLPADLEGTHTLKEELFRLKIYLPIAEAFNDCILFDTERLKSEKGAANRLNEIDKFASIHIKKGSSLSDVNSEALKDFIKNNSDAYLEDRKNFISYYDENCRVESIDKYLVQLSQIVSQPVLGVCKYEESIFCIKLYRNGALLTEGFWGEDETQINIDLLSYEFNLPGKRLNTILNTENIDDLASKLQSFLGVYF